MTAAAARVRRVVIILEKSKSGVPVVKGEWTVMIFPSAG
jgi:hypothetical protein